MRYVFIALLLFGAVVFAVPSLREQVMPTVQGKLDNRRTEAANVRIGEIVRLTESKGSQLPAPAAFKAFVDRGFPNHLNAGTDPWGTPYYLKRDQFNFWVGSAGPDRQANTADDILSKANPLPHNRYRGRRR